MTALAVSCVPGSTTSTSARPVALGTAGSSGRELRARADDRGREFARAIAIARTIRWPNAAARVEELRGRGVGHVRWLFRPVSSQWNRSGIIKNDSAMSNSGEFATPHRQQLIERVDLHELQAGLARRSLPAARSRSAAFEHPSVRGIAIAIWDCRAARRRGRAVRNRRPKYRRRRCASGRRTCRPPPRRPSTTLVHSPSRSQYRCPAAGTGPLSKRWTSSSVSRRPSNRPATCRPLEPPDRPPERPISAMAALSL